MSLKLFKSLLTVLNSLEGGHASQCLEKKEKINSDARHC